MPALTLAEWDAVWQRFYDRGVALGMSPNRSVARADDEMVARHGDRPRAETGARSE